MSPQEKRERRETKHKLQAAVKANLSLPFRLGSTPAQQRAAVKILTDRILAGQSPTDFVPLENAC